MINTIQTFLSELLGFSMAPPALVIAIAMVSIFLIAYAVWFASNLVVTRFLIQLIKASTSHIDDELLNRKVPGKIAHSCVALTISAIAPVLLQDFPTIGKALNTAALIYLVVIVALIIDALLDILLLVSSQYENTRNLPLRSLLQVIKIGIWFVAFMLTLSLLLGKSPVTLFAGLGAMTAVLMLVFKDPILGFAAGIQLSTNHMVSVGDWIEMPQHDVDGDVLEIALTTVKVHNFDNTITTVPTQSLTTDSFKNWRGMQESDGRRIKRAVVIDLNSVHFCDDEMLKRFSHINHISDYLKNKAIELEEFNSTLDLSSPANGRRLTNVGTFRAYIEAYLRHHPQVNQELTLLVRQLEPTESGLPIEIYVFCKEKRWLQYEGIQADIFDHILASAPSFDLRVFQNPSGADFSRLSVT